MLFYFYLIILLFFFPFNRFSSLLPVCLPFCTFVRLLSLLLVYLPVLFFLPLVSVFLLFGQRTLRGRCPIERGRISVRSRSPPRTWNPHPQGPEPLYPFFRSTRIYFPTQTDGHKFSPVFYRTSSPSGQLPKKEERKKVVRR